MIIGVISLVAVLGAFIGVYVLFWALNAYGVWTYVFIGVVIVAVALVFYILESHRERGREISHKSEIIESEDETT